LAALWPRVHDELPRRLADPDLLDGFVGTDVEIEVRDDRTVVRERIAPRRLLAREREREPGHGDLLGGREERHVQWIGRDRRRDAPTVEDDRAEPCRLDRDRRREPTRSGADDHDGEVAGITHNRSRGDGTTTANHRGTE